MTNPNNSIGTNAAYSGRTSVNAFNDVLGAFSGRGIVSGWGVSPNSGMTISLGGNGTTRDVAIAEDNAGNKTTVNNILGSPVSFEVAAAPATNSRIDSIVVYVVNPPVSEATIQDAYDVVGILDVQGTPSSSPVAPNDSAIRTAITADGASGSTAYYVVLANITVASGTTDITSNMISAGTSAVLNQNSVNIPDGSITSDKLVITSLPTSGTTSLPSITVQHAGTYLALGEINYYNTSAGSVGELDVQMEVGGTLVNGTDYILQAPGGASYSSYQVASWSKIIAVNAGQTVALNATTNTNMTLRKTSLVLVRIS